jgi:hypothetical protein
MRPSTFFGKRPEGYGSRSVTNFPSTNGMIESEPLPMAMGMFFPNPKTPN